MPKRPGRDGVGDCDMAAELYPRGRVSLALIVARCLVLEDGDRALFERYRCRPRRLYERRDLGRILYAGRALHAAGDIHDVGARVGDRGGDVLGGQAAREQEWARGSAGDEGPGRRYAAAAESLDERVVEKETGAPGLVVCERRLV